MLVGLVSARSISVFAMTLYHLLLDRKARLYARIRKAFKPGGRYIEGNYVVSPEKERRLLAGWK